MNAPITRAPKIKATLGEMIQIPIKTDKLKDVSAISLSLKYNKTFLSYIKTTLSDELTAKDAGYTNVFQMPGDGNENIFLWRLAWSQLEPITQLAHETVCIIEFNCLETGTTVLEWQTENGNCEYAGGIPSTPLEQTDDTYIDGYVKINQD